MSAIKLQLAWGRVRALLIAADVLALVVAFGIAYTGRFVLDVLPTRVPALDPIVALMCLPIWVGAFAAFGLYLQRNTGSGYVEYSRVGAACTYSLVAVVMTSYLDSNLKISRGFLLLFWLATIVLVVLDRFLARRVLRHLARGGLRMRRVLIVGASHQGIELARQLSSDAAASSEVFGFLDDYRPKGSLAGGYPVLGEPQELTALCARLGATHVVVVESALSWESLRFIVRTMHSPSPTEILLAPGMHDVNATPLELTQIGPALLLRSHPHRIVGVEGVLKRLLDLGLVIPVLIGTLPLQLFLLTLGWLRDGSPIEWIAIIGEGGTMLRLPKLRGKRTRALHLSRLPTLWLVVLGWLSLVGPRPLQVAEASGSEDWLKLSALKPGFIGPWWLVSGGRPDEVEAEIIVDLRYARSYTFWMDLRILWLAARSLLPAPAQSASGVAAREPAGRAGLLPQLAIRAPSDPQDAQETG
jgi:lipopolysaccharide/colanic/teichoic acid biosynthesis glycosyltransferase